MEKERKKERKLIYTLVEEQLKSESITGAGECRKAGLCIHPYLTEQLPDTLKNLPRMLKAQCGCSEHINFWYSKAGIILAIKKKVTHSRTKSHITHFATVC